MLWNPRWKILLVYHLKRSEQWRKKLCCCDGKWGVCMSSGGKSRSGAPHTNTYTGAIPFSTRLRPRAGFPLEAMEPHGLSEGCILQYKGCRHLLTSATTSRAVSRPHTLAFRELLWAARTWQKGWLNRAWEERSYGASGNFALRLEKWFAAPWDDETFSALLRIGADFPKRLGITNTSALLLSPSKTATHWHLWQWEA